MTSIHFTVPVAAEPRVVEAKLAEASADPTQFVHLFTTSKDITAEVARGESGRGHQNVWRVRVEGPQFKSKGTTVVLEADGGSDIEIQIDLRGKGLFGLASPLLGLAAGKVQDEASTALQKEFGLR